MQAIPCVCVCVLSELASNNVIAPEDHLLNPSMCKTRSGGEREEER